jgi:hypothetical protein
MNMDMLIKGQTYFPGDDVPAGHPVICLQQHKLKPFSGGPRNHTGGGGATVIVHTWN